MKKIITYKRLLGVSDKTDLQELKAIYRNMIKTWHPDKFHDDHEQKGEAESRSKQIIEAYHFLVSIAPETRAKTLSEFTTTTSTSGIADFEFKSDTLLIKFVDGNSYEFIGVTKEVYTKFKNAPAPGRFARRHIYNSFIYRNATSNMEAE